MQKESFTDKLIKRFYGIAGPLDEYKRREVDKIGNIAFIVLFYTLVFGNAIALFLGERYPKQVAFFYPIILTAVVLTLCLYVIFKGKKADISSFEVEELTTKEKKSLNHVGLKSGFFFGAFMHFFQAFNLASGPEQALIAFWTNPKLILLHALAGAGFGATMHAIVKSRQKKGEK